MCCVRGGYRRSSGRLKRRSPGRLPEMARFTSRRFWRVFPWDVKAAPGTPFSPQYIPPLQGSGRFDLDGSPSVLYLAESEVHAIGEKLQRYRGQEITEA